MRCHRRYGDLLKIFVVTVFLSTGLAACSGGGNDNVVYYVALGDSLSVGVQPDQTGANQETTNGYADQLFVMLQAKFPNLQLVKLGCPGETTESMANGGVCNDYASGSQLGDAAQFITDHADQVVLVTIDIGVNDLLSSSCLDLVNQTVDQTCLQTQFQKTGSNLSLILSTVFSAVAPGTPVIGMNYYDPFLAVALQGNIQFAQQSVVLAQALNDQVLAPVYNLFAFHVADVFTAFHTTDFTTMVPFPPPINSAPLNVATICQLTFMCQPPPVGPNIHATTPGYAAIAATFFQVFDSLTP